MQELYIFHPCNIHFFTIWGRGNNILTPISMAAVASLRQLFLITSNTVSKSQLFHKNKHAGQKCISFSTCFFWSSNKYHLGLQSMD